MKVTFIFSCFRMFRHVPEYSGIFHVPGFIDARRIARVIVYTWILTLYSTAVFSVASLRKCSMQSGGSKMSGSGSTPTKPVPAPRRGSKPKEPSASDKL